jgi:hypothetical protein
MISGPGGELLMEAESVAIAASWAGPIQKHIDYANANSASIPKTSRRTSIFK